MGRRVLYDDARLFYRWSPRRAASSAPHLRRQRHDRRPQLGSRRRHDHASGRLVYGATTGTLSAVDLSAGVPTGPTTVVSTGFGTSRALLVLNLPT